MSIVEYNTGMKYSEKDLQEHLSHEHNMSPFSHYLQEIVYGGIDGIVTTFAVVAGFAGAQSSSAISSLGYLPVLLFGLANLFADATSMGLGNFLSLRAEQDRYTRERNHEEYEVAHNPNMEKAESILLLQKKGFSKKHATELVSMYQKNPEFWVDFMMQYELEIDDPRGTNPFINGFVTFLSFMVFGVIPLLPYILLKDYPHSFVFAIITTGIALFSLGILRWRITAINPIRSILETMTLGTIAATVAYGVGIFFRA